MGPMGLPAPEWWGDMLGGSLGPDPGITICSSAERLFVGPWGVGGLPGPPARLLGVLEGAGEAGDGAEW